jgi:pyridoxal phosphate enzyme (YggS family)
MDDERESRVRLVGEFQDRLEVVQARIERAARRAGRDPGTVTLVAVSKTVAVGRLRDAVACGCRVFGESRVQEALAKMEVMGARAPAGVEWHLIGPIQSNKAKSVVGRFSLLHAVDRLEVAERLDRVARERGTVQPLLLEVNVAGEATKHGFKPDDLARAAERMGALAGLRLLGLMTIPPPAADPEEARPHFRRLCRLAATVEALKIPGVSMKELSMGMSGDFEVAVEEGATMVRIGTALFGGRGTDLKSVPA